MLATRLTPSASLVRVTDVRRARVMLRHLCRLCIPAATALLATLVLARTPPVVLTLQAYGPLLEVFRHFLGTKPRRTCYRFPRKSPVTFLKLTRRCTVRRIGGRDSSGLCRSTFTHRTWLWGLLPTMTFLPFAMFLTLSGARPWVMLTLFVLSRRCRVSDLRMPPMTICPTPGVLLKQPLNVASRIILPGC